MNAGRAGTLALLEAKKETDARHRRIERLRKLGEALGPWTASVFWLAILAGAIASIAGARWLYVVLVMAVCSISGWAILQIVRTYWRDLLGWLLRRFDKPG
jgi:hypothetical protein